MRFTKLLSLTFSTLALMACGEEEVKSVPKSKLKTMPKTVAEPEFQDMASLNAKKEAPSPQKATRLSLSSETPKPLESGPYVLQVGVSDDKDLADDLTARIEEMGYEPYVVKVENPAELVGTFYRVRLGYFRTVTDARLFGHNVLKPKNIGFWIDNSSNDKVEVAEPTQEEAMEQPATQTPSNSDWVEETPKPTTKAVTDDWEAQSETPMKTPETVKEAAQEEMAPKAEMIKETVQKEIPTEALPMVEKKMEEPVIPETPKTPEVKKVDGDSWEAAPKKAKEGNWEDDSWN